MKRTIWIFKEWSIFVPKNAKIQKFHKIFSLNFSEILHDHSHLKRSKSLISQNNFYSAQRTRLCTFCVQIWYVSYFLFRCCFVFGDSKIGQVTKTNSTKSFSLTMYTVVAFRRSNVWNQGKQINPCQLSVAFHIETSHLICSANQVTGFHMKCNTGVK